MTFPDALVHLQGTSLDQFGLVYAIRMCPFDMIHRRYTASLSHRLGGLCCIFCIYETPSCKPPFKIHLSLEELKICRHKWRLIDRQ
ncbi:hypothetical protein ACFX1X_032601 [Malus domestica]